MLHSVVPIVYWLICSCALGGGSGGHSIDAVPLVIGGTRDTNGLGVHQ
jgi:hypothetical protein